MWMCSAAVVIVVDGRGFKLMENTVADVSKAHRRTVYILDVHIKKMHIFLLENVYVIYKICSKIIINRLGVLADVDIGEEQNSFTKCGCFCSEFQAMNEQIWTKLFQRII